MKSLALPLLLAAAFAVFAAVALARLLPFLHVLNGALS